MKRTAVIVFTVFAASAIVMAQGRGAPAAPQPLEPGASQADVDRALLAAPANLKVGAMVIKWAPDQTYTVLRKIFGLKVCRQCSSPIRILCPFNWLMTSGGCRCKSRISPNAKNPKNAMTTTSLLFMWRIIGFLNLDAWNRKFVAYCLRVPNFRHFDYRYWLDN